MTPAVASALAAELVARHIDTHPPTWEDAPNLTEADWHLVQVELANWVARLYGVAGVTGHDAYMDATR